MRIIQIAKLLSLSLAAIGFALLLPTISACTPEQSEQPFQSAEGDTNREESSRPRPKILTPEEAEILIQENTATLLAHFQEVGYGKESYHPLEDLAEMTAEWCRGVTTSRIVEARSELQEGGGNILTVTDEEGNTFILPLGPNGNLDMIKDGEGNILFTIIR